MSNSPSPCSPSPLSLTMNQPSFYTFPTTSTSTSTSTSSLSSMSSTLSSTFSSSTTSSPSSPTTTKRNCRIRTFSNMNVDTLSKSFERLQTPSPRLQSITEEEDDVECESIRPSVPEMTGCVECSSPIKISVVDVSEFVF